MKVHERQLPRAEDAEDAEVNTKRILLNPDPEDRESADYADYTDLGGQK